MNYEEAQNFINSFSRLGKKVNDLSRIKKLLDKLDNPQNKLKFVHIAGTNGKGSTLEYIANALQNAGYTAGKFTSPYVTHYADRIRVNSSEIDEKSIAEICGFVAERVESREFSQFEITMSIAFIYFLRQKCDVVVLETGIGGLVDSTNIIAPPLLSVITSVSYDHTAILGETLEEIAEQKAGIIKSKSNAVISVDNEEVCKDVLRKKADEMNAVLTEININDIRIIKSDVLGNEFFYKNSGYTTFMGGIHQIYNAVTAIEACGILKSKGFNISHENISDALKYTGIQGRIQYFSGNPPVILDGGHNVSGAEALACVLRKIEKNKIYTALGMVDGKDYVHSAGKIAEVSGYVCCVDGFSKTSIKAELLQNAVKGYIKSDISDYKKGIEMVKQLAKENNGVAVVCGSLYLVSAYLNL